jgi:hypothetical protein
MEEDDAKKASNRLSELITKSEAAAKAFEAFIECSMMLLKEGSDTSITKHVVANPTGSKSLTTTMQHLVDVHKSASVERGLMTMGFLRREQPTT